MEQFVLVCVADNDAFTRAHQIMYNDWTARADAEGGRLGFSLEQFIRYTATAVKVRVEYVLHGRWRDMGYRPTGMSIRDRWKLVIPVHDTLSSIGTVALGASGLQMFPVWDSQADALVFTRDERDSITPQIAAAAEAFGVKTVDSISSDQDGHKQVMLLTWIPTLREWWATEPVGREDGSTSQFLGLRPIVDVSRADGGPEYTYVDTDELATQLRLMPSWAPPLTLAEYTVVRYMHEFADLGR
jgi:hypothetical protein